MAPDAQQPVMIVFYLAPTFSLFDFSLAVETLRLANQVLGYADHRWRIASETGPSEIELRCASYINQFNGRRTTISLQRAVPWDGLYL